MAFLDESGSIAHDRFFGVGCLKLSEPSVLLRQVQKLRDRHHWYKEIHFKQVTAGVLPVYRDVVEVVAASEHEFSCFVADRDEHDPVARFGTHWRAYQKLSEQLIHGSIRPRELLTVLADNYSTPDHVRFEEGLKTELNERLGRLGVVTVCRLDSASTDALQVVDLLTSAVTFEFRQAAGQASASNAKAALAAHVRARYGVDSFLHGCKVGPINVAIYTPKTRRARASRASSRGQHRG
ncbi:MAG TPA: DUF3800 domain-containing protein [Solirubrobacteraceae bacterium]